MVLKAAEQGESTAQYYLAVCYYKGDGITQDYAQAVQNGFKGSRTRQ